MYLTPSAQLGPRVLQGPQRHPGRLPRRRSPRRLRGTGHSPASQSGWQAGDRITAINRQRIGAEYLLTSAEWMCALRLARKSCLPLPQAPHDRTRRLLRGRVCYQTSDRSLDWNRQDSRGQVHAIRPAKRGKPKERSQCRQSSIPRADAVVALRFEVVEKPQDDRRIEIVERQRAGARCRSCCRKSSRRQNASR
jgi:hypothetical protein